MNDLFISEKNISLQKKSTTQVNAQCTLEIQLVQCLNLMTLAFISVIEWPRIHAFVPKPETTNVARFIILLPVEIPLNPDVVPN